MESLSDKLSNADVPSEYVEHGEAILEMANKRQWKKLLAYYREQELEIQNYIQREKKYSWCMRAARVGCL